MSKVRIVWLFVVEAEVEVRRRGRRAVGRFRSFILIGMISVFWEDFTCIGFRKREAVAELRLRVRAIRYRLPL